MFGDRSCSKAVAKSNQRPIQHFDVETPRFIKFAIDVPVGDILQRRAHLRGVTNCYLERGIDVAMGGRKVLLILTCPPF